MQQLVLPELMMPSSMDLGVLVREIDGQTAGYLNYRRYLDAWTVNDVFVVPGHRGRGLASSLLEELLSRAEQPVVLRVAGSASPGTLSDEELDAWYRRHGFTEHPSWGHADALVCTNPAQRQEPA